jgi:hypothetical protein
MVIATLYLSAGKDKGQFGVWGWVFGVDGRLLFLANIHLLITQQ